MTGSETAPIIPAVLAFAFLSVFSPVSADASAPSLQEEDGGGVPGLAQGISAADGDASLISDFGSGPGGVPDCGHRLTASLVSAGLWDREPPESAPVSLAAPVESGPPSAKSLPCPGGLIPPAGSHPATPVRLIPRQSVPAFPGTDLGLRSRSTPFQLAAIDPTVPYTDESCAACTRMILRTPAQEWEAEQMQKDIRNNTKNGARLAMQAGLIGAMMLAGQAGPGDAGILLTRRGTYLAENLVLTAALRHWQKPIPPHSDYLVMDGHTHTNASHDSSVNIEEKLISADRAGYDVIAITDHNSIWAAQEAARLLPGLKEKGLVRPEFQVVVGEEILATGGYILAYFIETAIVDGMTLEETIRAVHRQGGVAVLAHPAENSETRASDEWIESSDLDGVEAGSGRPEKPYDFYELYHHRDEFPGKSKMFGGDSHVTEQTGMLFGYTVLETTDHSPEGIKRALREGRAHVEYTGISHAYADFIRMPVIGPFYRAFSEYDSLKGRIGGLLARMLYADDVVIWTRWDTALYQAVNLIDLPFMFTSGESTENRFWNSGGDRITAFYGPVSITYKPTHTFVGLEYVLQF